VIFLETKTPRKTKDKATNKSNGTINLKVILRIIKRTAWARLFNLYPNLELTTIVDSNFSEATRSRFSRERGSTIVLYRFGKRLLSFFTKILCSSCVNICIKMKFYKFAALLPFLLQGPAQKIRADDPLPEGVIAAIRNGNIPTIADVGVINFNEEGHGKIKVHAIYKSELGANQKKKENKSSFAKWIRGYGLEGSNKVTPLKLVVNGKTGRFLFFLDGDLLYSTYNNQFPIRKTKDGSLEVGTAFNGGGAPWKPLKEIIKLIPQKSPKEKEK
jgi:hypothetical protein